MKFMPLGFIVIALNLAYISPALAAQQGPYAGLQYSLLDWDITNPQMISAQAGYQLNNGLALEGRIGIGTFSDTVDGIDVGLKSLLGLYGRYTFTVDHSLSLYGLVGVTNAELEFSYRGSSASVDDTSASFGFGSEFKLQNNTFIGLEYMLYNYDFKDSSASLAGIGINASYHF